MSEPYTPTTEQARRYWQYGANAWLDNVARDDDAGPDGSIGAEFDRWLDRVRAEAWDEAYETGIDDERVSESNIGIAGLGGKVGPCRSNPYRRSV